MSQQERYIILTTHFQQFKSGTGTAYEQGICWQLTVGQCQSHRDFMLVKYQRHKLQLLWVHLCRCWNCALLSKVLFSNESFYNFTAPDERFPLFRCRGEHFVPNCWGQRYSLGTFPSYIVEQQNPGTCILMHDSTKSNTAINTWNYQDIMLKAGMLFKHELHRTLVILAGAESLAKPCNQQYR